MHMQRLRRKGGFASLIRASPPFRLTPVGEGHDHPATTERGRRMRADHLPLKAFASPNMPTSRQGNCPLSIVKRSIDAALAQRLVDAAIEAARAGGKPMCIAIMNEARQLKAYHAMDGAPFVSEDIAINKAWTVASFGIPTHAWWDFIKEDGPLLHGVVQTPRVVVYGGGYPIMEEGQMIGAIGVSGGHYSDDMAVARGALEALGLPVG